MDVALLTVGDELLIGQVVNTNAAWMGEQCTLNSLHVTSSEVLPDNVAILTAGLRAALLANDAVIITGGLGPTHDDLTRDAVAACFKTHLVENEAIVDALRKRFEHRGRTFPESNKVQALVPVGIDVLPNPVGTAPGLWFDGEFEGRTVRLAVLPGVPREMKRMMMETVLPRLRGAAGHAAIQYRTVLTCGIGESHLQDRVGSAEELLRAGQELAYLPSESGVRLRVTGSGEEADQVQADLDATVASLKNRLGNLVFGEGTVQLEAVVGEMLKGLGLTLSTAESCTGGLVSDRLTNIPGSSAYFLGGVVSYHNAVKQGMLGVDQKDLALHGAVSEAVAMQMAQGVRERLGSDIGISATGIMGPDGGSEEKPVGTIWFGYADDKGVTAKKHILLTERRHNKLLGSTYLLNWLRLQLLQRS